MLIQERTLKSEEKDIIDFLDKNFKKEDEKYNISGEILNKDEIFKMLDVSDPISTSTNSKNIQFEKVILNWWKNGKKPNEDTDYIFRTLKRYQKVQAKNIKLPKKAIEYNSPGELDSELDNLLPNDDLGKNYPGKIVKTDGDYVLRQIDTWEDAQQCFKDSGWCVQNKNMFDSYKPPYFMITHKEPNGTEKRVALAHKDSSQLKDVKDDPLPYSIGKDFLPLIDYVFDLKTPTFYVASDWSKDDIIDYNKNKIAIDKPMTPNELELLSKNAMMSYRYADEIIKRRFPEGEAAIAKFKPQIAYDYAFNVLNHGTTATTNTIKFPEAEELISTHPQYAYKYAENILRDRFPKGEAAIAKDPNYAYLYAIDVIHGKWPEIESLISKYAVISSIYAKDVIKGRFPEGEAAIATDPYWAYKYVKDVINKNTPKDQPGIRWPEGEATIAKGPEYAYKYARDVIKRRFPEGEAEIKTIPTYQQDYDTYVLNGEGEELGLYSESQDIISLRNDLKKIFI